MRYFVQLNEKNVQIFIFFVFSGSVVYGKQLRQIYNHDIYFYIHEVIYVTLANFTEQA